MSLLHLTRRGRGGGGNSVQWHRGVCRGLGGVTTTTAVSTVPHHQHATDFYWSLQSGTRASEGGGWGWVKEYCTSSYWPTSTLTGFRGRAILETPADGRTWLCHRQTVNNLFYKSTRHRVSKQNLYKAWSASASQVLVIDSWLVCSQYLYNRQASDIQQAFLNKTNPIQRNVALSHRPTHHFWALKVIKQKLCHKTMIEE